MAVDGGFPISVTIPVPDSIEDGKIGAYVTYKVGQHLDEVGTLHLHRRSVMLSFLHPRLALLRYEQHVRPKLSQEERTSFDLAEARTNGASDAERKPRAYRA